MKKNAFLRGLLLLGTLCLTVLPAGAQTENLRNKMGELYDLGYTDSWFSKALAKSYITSLYYQNLRSTANPDSIGLNKEQKIRRAEQITELYASKSLRNDMINLLTANLPETCSEQQLSDYIKDKVFRINDKYRNAAGKILILTRDSTVQSQVKATFNAPLRKLAKAKAIKPKPIDAQACPESYTNAFASFWSKCEYHLLLEDIIEREIHNAATGIQVYGYGNSDAEARRELDRESQRRRDKMEKYCTENAPLFWRNLLLEKGITEEDLLLLTPTLSAESMESIKQLNQHMVQHQNDNKQALLSSFSSWLTVWYNDKDENHSVLTQTPPTPTKPTEENSEYNDQVYETAQVNPEFLGGLESLMQWLSKNIKYPIVCREQDVQGRVYVSFVVEKDGCITNVKIMRSPDPAMSAEVLRVLSIMPSWIPGMQDGEPVRVKHSLPIMFRLS